jgi:tetratricopeptide (TPR) repeat protein
LLPGRASLFFFAALASLALPAPRPAAAQPADLDALLARAVELHQAGDLEGAANLYVEVLRAAPQASRVRSNLGAAWAGLGRYEDAIDQYRQALAQEDDPSIRRNLAVALVKTGVIGEAAVEAERALLAQPSDRDALLLLADCRLRLGDDARVVDLLAPAAARAPDDRAVAFLLGTALLNLGRIGDAQKVMDRVFRDDSPESHVLLGTMHTKRKDWAAALVEYGKAREANPKLPLVNFLYGEALMRQSNDWSGAAAAFRAELALDPNHFESNLLLGTLLREGGQTEEALQRLERAARVRGDDLAVQFSLGAAYLASGELDRARRMLEAVAAAAPNHLPTQMQLAQLYARTGDTAAAARVRASVVRLQKESDSRAFQGVRESITDLLDRPSPSNTPVQESPRP